MTRARQARRNGKPISSGRAGRHQGNGWCNTIRRKGYNSTTKHQQIRRHWRGKPSILNARQRAHIYGIFDPPIRPSEGPKIRAKRYPPK